MMLLSHWARRHHVRMDVARNLWKGQIQEIHGYEFVEGDKTPAKLGYVRTHEREGYVSIENYHRKWGISPTKILKEYIAGRIHKDNLFLHVGGKQVRTYVRDLPPQELINFELRQQEALHADGEAEAAA